MNLTKLTQILDAKGITDREGFLRANGLVEEGTPSMVGNIFEWLNDKAVNDFVKRNAVLNAKTSIANPVSAVAKTYTNLAGKSQNFLGTGWGLLEDERLSVAPTGGIAIKADDGSFRAYDGKDGAVVKLGAVNLDIMDMFFVVPESTLKEGMFVIVDSKYMFVEGVDERGRANCIDVNDETIKRVLPSKNILGFSSYNRVVSPLTLLGVDNYGSFTDMVKGLDTKDLATIIKPLLVIATALTLAGPDKIKTMASNFNIQELLLPTIAQAVTGSGKNIFADGKFNMEALTDKLAELLGTVKDNLVVSILVSVAVILFGKNMFEDVADIVPFDMEDVKKLLPIVVLGGLALFLVKSETDVLGMIKGAFNKGEELPTFEDDDLEVAGEESEQMED